MSFDVHVPNLSDLTPAQRDQLEHLGDFQLGITLCGARPAAVVCQIDADDAATAASKVAQIVGTRPDMLTVVESV